MKLLLDTHVLLWALLEPQKLSPELRNTLENSDNTLVVSAASAWEIAVKWRLGKLQHARAVFENYAMTLHRLAAVDWPISGVVARQAGLWAVPHAIPTAARKTLSLIASWRLRPGLTTSCWPAPIRRSPTTTGSSSGSRRSSGPTLTPGSPGAGQ